MDKKQIRQVTLIENIRNNILDKSNVKNTALAVEIARKWVKRQ